ncbi:MAG: AAA family ATPase [Treponema sp.]|nr:AAA family ATPase [Treponema sp.]
MVNMRKMPIGIQDFETLRTEGYVYVDKTALIYDLVQKGKPYFLSRPRRFGKSLLVTTLEAYFKGRKELFEGLAIAELETEWAEYPVLHFDFNGQNYSDPKGLNMMIDAHLRKWEEHYGIEKQSPSPGLRLADIIEGAYRQSGRNGIVNISSVPKHPKFI